ncbi:hypothetical protein EII34_14330 [Arachnia propionica]|uniref:Uncharacterized protein n=1 Tax=Arachnia propionica TaxID=1750 RepID=A0A3P1T3G7_9ACTN|nr:hypothetical protein [Arachnia propionica]RRD03366.1 hypothetical protein EII34_14330 [Arachnia propionica]
MTPQAWTQLDPGTRILDIVPATVLVFTDTESRLVSLVNEGNQVCSLSVVGASGMRLLGLLEADEVVGGLTQRVLGLPNGRCVLLPPLVRVSPPQWVWTTSILGTVAVTVLLTFLLRAPLLLLPGLLLALVLIPVMIGTVLSRFEVLGQRKRGIIGAASLHAWARRMDPKDPPQELPVEPPLTPEQRAERVRQEYGRLRTDLVYRLENPALFDPAVPTTAAFEAALVECDDEVSFQTANRLEVRFNLARQHAERVGLGHVDDVHRDEVARAVKVARLAVGASSTGERATALGQLQRILDGLALYYLPARTNLAELEG